MADGTRSEGGTGQQPSDASHLLALRRGFLSAFLVILAVAAVLPVKYEVNDDIGMITILSGIDGFPASTDAPFISRFLGYTFWLLYQVSALIPWYGLLLYLTLLLGTGLFFSILFLDSVDRYCKLLILPAYLALIGHCLVSVTFTSATLLLQFGVFLFVLAWLSSQRRFPLPKGLLFACLVLSYLWRWKLFLVFLVYALPLAFFLNRDDRRHLKTVMPFLLLAVAIVGADRGLAFLTTRGPQHAHYQTFLRYNARFHDTPLGREGPRTEKALASANWTKDDYAMFHEYWMAYDERRLSVEALDTFLRENNSHVPAWSWLRMRQALSSAYGANRLNTPVLICCCLALLFYRGGSLLQAPRGDVLRVLGAIGIFGVLTIGLVNFRFVGRVSIPIMAYFVGMLAVLPSSADGQGNASAAGWKKILRRASQAGAIVFCILSLWAAAHWARADFSSLRTSRAHWRFMQQSLTEASAGRANPMLLIQLYPPSSYAREWIHPLMDHRERSGVRLLPGGWTIRSPRYYRVLRQLDLQNGLDLLRGSIDSPDIRFLLMELHDKDVSPAVGQWQSYFNRHVQPVDAGGHRRVTLIPEREFVKPDGLKLVIYRLESQADH